jgi:hypothetical protein
MAHAVVLRKGDAAMAVSAKKVEVWAGEISDQPGGLSRVLSALSEAGADLECVIARRSAERPGSGVVFLTPVKGRKVQEAAKAVGLMPASNIATLRVEGADKPGLGGKIMAAMSELGINVRGVSAAVVGNKFVAYIGLDSADDAAKAARAIGKIK